MKTSELSPANGVVVDGGPDADVSAFAETENGIGVANGKADVIVALVESKFTTGQGNCQVVFGNRDAVVRLEVIPGGSGEGF